jgi:outer membrane lipoprotein-sorting protein
LPANSEVMLKSKDIETYLNSIKTLHADLIQISSNGEVQTGILLIKKPGQLRFEYDAPSDHIVIASGLLLVIIDKKSTSEPQRYLTSQTPIGYLLDETVNLRNHAALEAIAIKDTLIHVSFYDKKKPTAGKLRLVFSQNPIALKEWTITNYSGEETRVLLEKLSINKPINKNLFNIGLEISKAKKRSKVN